MGQEVCSKDRVGDSGQDKVKGEAAVAELDRGGPCPPSRQGRTIGGDQVGSRWRCCGLVGQDAPLCASVYQKIVAGAAVVQMEQMAAGGDGVYKPPAADAFSDCCHSQGARQMRALAPNLRWKWQKRRSGSGGGDERR